MSSEEVFANKMNGIVTGTRMEENGFVYPVSVSNKEKEVHGHIQHSHGKTTDDNLFEFSEAMETLTKALIRVAEGKAAAQAEAAEWKLKYETEKALILKQRGTYEGFKEKYVLDDSIEIYPALDQNERCCENHGICAHEMLQDKMTDSKDKFAFEIDARKAPFKLSWGCNAEKSGQHKHEIVSFEKGNITTALRSSKQILLKWDSQPQTVLILSKPNSNPVRLVCVDMVRWLKEIKRVAVFVEPRVKTELLTESSYFDFVQTWENDEEVAVLHLKVDLVVTLGGDGTVLWAATMFKGPVPLVVPFSLGSLGFMTPFQSERFRDSLDSVLRGPISITLRHRLQCYIIRDTSKDELLKEEPILVLNEVTIDRGISSYLTCLDCYCDNAFVTSVQGDGLILSTTSGSTAYSLAAGGAMVHPQVPAILFTPICPHSLSFRPLILPEYVTVRVQVPCHSRGHAWVSFDGKGRMQLASGDALICSMAPCPVPTACNLDSTNDFLHSIQDGLHWNMRKKQSLDGPREA